MVLLASTGVSATESGFYLGAGGSDGSVSLEQSSAGWATLGRSVERSGVQFDDSDFGWEVFVGFQFNRFVGAETDFQESDETSAAFVAATSGNSFINEQAQVSEFSGAVTGTYPLNREFGLFGKVGAVRWNVDGTATTAAGAVRRCPLRPGRAAPTCCSASVAATTSTTGQYFDSNGSTTAISA